MVRRDPKERQVHWGRDHASAWGGDDALEKCLCQLCFASPWFTVIERLRMFASKPLQMVVSSSIPLGENNLLGGLLFLLQTKQRGFSLWTPTAMRTDKAGSGSIAERNPNWLYSSWAWYLVAYFWGNTEVRRSYKSCFRSRPHLSFPWQIAPGTLTGHGQLPPLPRPPQ